MTIRIHGFAHEVEKAVRALENIPGITLVRESKDYSDRNSSYIRRYLDMEFTDMTDADPAHQNG